MNKITFEVVYNPKQLVAIGKIMKGFDVGVSKIELPVKSLWSWKTDMDIDRSYIARSKKGIKEVLEKEGHELISVNKVKNEKDN